MTPWELAACVQGFNIANGGDTQIEPPSDEDFDRMLSGTVH
jgi:hypothetical protein